MTTKVRRQLTLFIQKEDSEIIEKVRQKFNPAQFELIKAHVTLCREDEIDNIAEVMINLASLDEEAITIQFERPSRFDNGRGVYLNSNDTGKYNSLRQKILEKIIDEPRHQIPHITLMHPRNATCDDDIFEQICMVDFPSYFTFKEVSLIEQKMDGKWEVLKTFSLTK